MDIFPVVTLFLGYGASYLTEFLRDRRTVRRDREARAASQQERNFERHVTFQAKMLLEMQEAALDLVQTGTEYLIQWNSRTIPPDGWRRMQPRDASFNRFLLAQARSEMIAARVDDSTARKRSEEIRTHSGKLLGSQDSEEASKGLAFMFGYSEKLNERIGEVLRELNAVEIKSGIGRLPPPHDPERNMQEHHEPHPELTQG